MPYSDISYGFAFVGGEFAGLVPTVSALHAVVGNVMSAEPHCCEHCACM